MSVAENLARVRERMAAVCQRAGRSPDEVTLVGVSKGVPAPRVAEEHSAGLQDVGENRAQEAADKIETLFLAAFTRMPSDEELEFLLKHIESQPDEESRGRAYEEVFWGLLNGPEFVLSR